MNEQGRVTVIGMIVAGPMGQDQVRTSTADQTDDLHPRFETHLEMAVPMVQNGVLDTKYPSGRGSLGSTALRQLGATLLVVSGRPVGNADILNMMPAASPQDSSSGCSDFAVVRVCTNDQDPARGHVLAPCFRVPMGQDRLPTDYLS